MKKYYYLLLFTLFSHSFLFGQKLILKEVVVNDFAVHLCQEGEQIIHQEIAWANSSSAYLVAMTLQKGDKIKTVLHSSFFEPKYAREIKVPRNQVLHIDKVMPLQLNEIFLHGVIYCAKNPQKKLYNWYACCDVYGNVLRQRKEKYKEYQVINKWQWNKIGLLYNPVVGGGFSNRPQIELLNLETLKRETKKTVVFKFDYPAVFINNFKRMGENILVFGMEVENLHTNDSSRYAKPILCEFDTVKLIENILEETENILVRVDNKPVSLDLEKYNSYTGNTPVIRIPVWKDNERKDLFVITEIGYKLELAAPIPKLEEKINDSALSLYDEPVYYGCYIGGGYAVAANEKNYPIIRTSDTTTYYLEDWNIYDKLLRDDAAVNKPQKKIAKEDLEEGQVMLVSIYSRRQELYANIIVLYTPKGGQVGSIALRFRVEFVL